MHPAFQAHSASIAGRDSNPRRLQDLLPDLLANIFQKLGPSPAHLAAVSCVCKDWQRIIIEDTLKHICLTHAPGLCALLLVGYCSPSNACSEPPGGWKALYKFLTFCPGVPNRLASFRDHFWNPIGHVLEVGQKFYTGRHGHRLGTWMMEDLRGSSIVLVAEVCRHEQSGSDLTHAWGICKGMVLDRTGSVEDWAKKVGFTTAAAKEPHTLCTFCGAPLYELVHRSVGSYAQEVCAQLCESVRLPEDQWPPFDLSLDVLETHGYVCNNGHLMLTPLMCYWAKDPLSWGSVLEGAGEDLQLDNCRLIKTVCKEFGPESKLPSDWSPLEFMHNLDVFSLAGDLRRLAQLVESGNQACSGKGSPDGEVDSRENSLRNQAHRELVDEFWAAEIRRKDLAKEISIRSFETDSDSKSEGFFVKHPCPDPCTGYLAVPVDSISILTDLQKRIPESGKVICEYLAAGRRGSVTAAFAFETISELQRLDAKQKAIKSVWAERRAAADAKSAAAGPSGLDKSGE